MAKYLSVLTGNLDKIIGVAKSSISSIDGMDVSSLSMPTITATAKGPNQINLTWSAVTNPGWGYKVEIQSSGDSRYTGWTDLTARLVNGRTYLDYWVTESHYLDPTDGSGSGTGSACQFPVFGLKYNTAYNFRVRSYGKNDSGTQIYSSYSDTATATTYNPSTIRHVKAGGPYGDGDGTSEANAWGHIYDANSLTAGATNGTLILVHSGNYASDYWHPGSSGASQSRKIVLQADYGETVTITSIGSGAAIDFSGRSYCVMDGIKFAGVTIGTEVFLMSTSTSRCTWANCEIDASANPAVYSPGCYGAYNLLHHNYFHDIGRGDPTGGTAITLCFSQCQYNFVQFSHHSKCGHDCAIVNTDASYNAVLNNLLDGGHGMGFESHHASHHNLFEGNICKDAMDLDDSYAKPGFEVSSDYNTVRRNIVYSNGGNGCEITALESSNARGNLVYNNTFYDNACMAVDFMNASLSLIDNIVANNIFYRHGGVVDDAGYTTPLYICLRGTPYTGTTIHNNIFLHYTGGEDSPSSTIICVGNPGDTQKNVADANADWSTYFHDNKTTAPTFLDATNGDFHLKSTSYGLALGEAITDSTWGNMASGTSLGAYNHYTIE